MATSCGFESHRPHQPSLAKRVKAATPEPKAKAGCSARELRLGKPKRDRRSLSASESEDGLADGTGYGGTIVASRSFRNAPAGNAEQHDLRRCHDAARL